MHNYRYDQKHFQIYELCILTMMKNRAFESYDYRTFQSIWLYLWIQFWKKRESKVLNSAHDYSYEIGSYNFKAKYTVIAEPTELQKIVHMQ